MRTDCCAAATAVAAAPAVPAAAPASRRPLLHICRLRGPPAGPAAACPPVPNPADAPAAAPPRRHPCRCAQRGWRLGQRGIQPVVAGAGVAAHGHRRAGAKGHVCDQDLQVGAALVLLGAVLGSDDTFANAAARGAGGGAADGRVGKARLRARLSPACSVCDGLLTPSWLVNRVVLRPLQVQGLLCAALRVPAAVQQGGRGVQPRPRGAARRQEASHLISPAWAACRRRRSPPPPSQRSLMRAWPRHAPCGCHRSRPPSPPPRVTPLPRSLWCAPATRPPQRSTPACWMPSTCSRRVGAWQCAWLACNLGKAPGDLRKLDCTAAQMHVLVTPRRAALRACVGGALNGRPSFPAPRRSCCRRCKRRPRSWGPTRSSSRRSSRHALGGR